MFNKILNCAFQATAKCEKKKAAKIVNEYSSISGVQQFLSRRLDANENARLAAFEGIVKSQLNANNKLEAALARLDASFKSNQM